MIEDLLLRRLSWFTSDWTGGDHEIPARFGPRVVALLSLLPPAVVSALAMHQFLWLVGDLVFLILFAGEDARAYRRFRRGMRIGRDEFLREIIVAWREHGMHPPEYLLREVYFGDAEAERLLRSATDHPAGPRRHTH